MTVVLLTDNKYLSNLVTTNSNQNGNLFNFLSSSTPITVLHSNDGDVMSDLSHHIHFVMLCFHRG